MTEDSRALTAMELLKVLFNDVWIMLLGVLK